MNMQRQIAQMMKKPSSGGLYPPDAFVLVFDIPFDGLTLALKSDSRGVTFDASFDWGDGVVNTVTSHSDPNLTHTFPSAGTYTVQITGQFGCLKMISCSDADQSKLIGLEQWGGMAFYFANGMFSSCENLVVNAVDAPDMSNCSNVEHMFKNASLADPDVSKLFPSAATSLVDFLLRSGYTEKASSANAVTSKITSLSSAFEDVPATFIDCEYWDVSKVGSFSRLFLYTPCDPVVWRWDISSATTMANMCNTTNFSDNNYSDALIAWNDLPSTPSGISFHAGPAKVEPRALAAKANLESTYGWTIADSGNA